MKRDYVSHTLEMERNLLRWKCRLGLTVAARAIIERMNIKSSLTERSGL